MTSNEGNCIACHGYLKLDRCHVKSKGSGGPNEHWNIFLACRDCHMLQHRIGMLQFLARYPLVKEYLEFKGWEFEFVLGRFLMTHPGLK